MNPRPGFHQFQRSTKRRHVFQHLHQVPAVVGMGCTKFGENWDQSFDDLVIDADGLVLPRADISRYAFVLGPLAEP